MSEHQNQAFQLTFNLSSRAGFQGSRVTSDCGLLQVRQLNDCWGLSELTENRLTDSRSANTRLLFLGLLPFVLLFVFSSVLAAQQKSATSAPPEIIKVPADVAATHLIKKASPLYPAFAKAAGIEGVVRIELFVSPDGHIHQLEATTGWDCLRDAAMTAAGQYLYRPFEKDHRAVIARTTVNIVFKLPGPNHKLLVHPPPQLTWEELGNFTQALPVPLDAVSPELRKWVRDLANRLAPQCVGGVPPFSPEELERLARIKEELPDAFAIKEIPSRKPAAHLYVLFEGTQVCPNNCGATGNCDKQLLEDSAGRIHLIANAGGFAVGLVPNPDSPYPDVFFTGNLSATTGDITGYTNIGGQWGAVYCGGYTGGDTEFKSDIHLCQ